MSGAAAAFQTLSAQRAAQEAANSAAASRRRRGSRSRGAAAGSASSRSGKGPSEAEVDPALLEKLANGETLRQGEQDALERQVGGSLVRSSAPGRHQGSLARLLRQASSRVRLPGSNVSSQPSSPPSATVLPAQRGGTGTSTTATRGLRTPLSFLRWRSERDARVEPSAGPSQSLSRAGGGSGAAGKESARAGHSDPSSPTAGLRTAEMATLRANPRRPDHLRPTGGQEGKQRELGRGQAALRSTAAFMTRCFGTPAASNEAGGPEAWAPVRPQPCPHPGRVCAALPSPTPSFSGARRRRGTSSLSPRAARCCSGG